MLSKEGQDLPWAARMRKAEQYLSMVLTAKATVADTFLCPLLPSTFGDEQQHQEQQQQQ